MDITAVAWKDKTTFSEIAVFMYALHANCVVSTARNGNSSFHKHPWYVVRSQTSFASFA